MEDKFLNELFISKWLQDGLTEIEKNEFNEWLQVHNEHRKLFEEFRLIWDQAGQISFPTHNKQIVWEKIRSKISQTASGKPYPFISGSLQLLQWAIPAAATILIIIGLYYFLQKDTLTVEALNGKVTHVILPDSSEVILNAGSQMEYPTSGWEETRNVKLMGEAYFKIRKAQTSFIVISDDVSIEVLGTEFNVKTRNDKTEIVCTKGKVKVASAYSPQEPVFLTAGMGTHVREHSVPVKPYLVDSDKKTGWLKGELHFEQEQLFSVFEEIERQYNVTIRTNLKNSNQKFTGQLKVSQVRESLDLICLIAGIDYTQINDSTFFIHQ